MSEFDSASQYINYLEGQWIAEQQAACDHPDEELEFGRLNWVNNFHGSDQRVYCKKCGDSWWW